MLQAFLKPRPLGAAAVVAFAVGVVLLYAGLPSLGPMVMLVGVLLAILAAIAWTTPEDQVAAARLALAQRGTPAPLAPRRTARVYDAPGQDDPRIHANRNE